MKPWFVHLSDDEYVENIRQSIERWERWRFVLMFCLASFIVAFAWGLVTVIQRAFNVLGQPNIPLVQLGLTVGAAIGLSIGFSLSSVASICATAAKGFRQERLLLKYYDAIHEMPSNEDDSGGAYDDAERE